MDKIFVYGSLRAGMYNQRHFADGMKHIDTKTIKGFDLYSLGAYPYVVETEEGGELTIDVMEVTPEAKARIDRMEKGAGYYLKDIEVDGIKGTIYLMEQPIPNTQKVESGDWVKFKTT